MQHHKLHLTTRFKVTAIAAMVLLVAVFCFFLVHYSPEVHQVISEATPIENKGNADLIRGISEKQTEESHEEEQQGDGEEDFTVVPDELLSKESNHHEMMQRQYDTPPKENTAAESAISVYEGQTKVDESKPAEHNHEQQSREPATNNKTFIADEPHSPITRYEVKAGALIPAILVTAINSDLPGKIVARVSQNVFDTVTGNYLLLPQGTTLLGTYDSHIANGQQRALVIWNRMIFPNGSSMQLEGQEGVDLVGHAGLHDKVNNHTLKVYGNALMFSFLTAAGQLSQPKKTDDKISAQEIMYASVGQQMVQVSSQSIAKNLNIQPTIEIREGTHFNVMLGQDLILQDVYHFQDAS